MPSFACRLLDLFQRYVKLSAAVHELLTLHYILDFDSEYLWNGSSNRQAKDGVINHDFF